MERQEFIKSLGIGFIAACSGACLSSCGKSNDNKPIVKLPEPGTIVSANLSTITSVGSFTKVSNVLFIRLTEGDTVNSFLAVQANCTHENGDLIYIPGNNNIQCQKHSARFATDGSVINGPFSGGTVTPIKVYALKVTASTLEATIS